MKAKLEFDLPLEEVEFGHAVQGFRYYQKLELLKLKLLDRESLGSDEVYEFVEKVFEDLKVFK